MANVLARIEFQRNIGNCMDYLRCLIRHWNVTLYQTYFVGGCRFPLATHIFVNMFVQVAFGGEGFTTIGAGYLIRLWVIGSGDCLLTYSIIEVFFEISTCGKTFATVLTRIGIVSHLKEEKWMNWIAIFLERKNWKMMRFSISREKLLIILQWKRLKNVAVFQFLVLKIVKLCFH